MLKLRIAIASVAILSISSLYITLLTENIYSLKFIQNAEKSTGVILDRTNAPYTGIKIVGCVNGSSLEVVYETKIGNIISISKNGYKEFVCIFDTDNFSLAGKKIDVFYNRDNPYEMIVASSRNQILYDLIINAVISASSLSILVYIYYKLYRAKTTQ